jgi:hypothetical protein
MLWVFRRVPALDNAQGFVDVPDKLVEKLVAEKKAAFTYDQTLELEPDPPPRKRKAAADDDDEPTDDEQPPDDDAARRRSRSR